MANSKLENTLLERSWCPSLPKYIQTISRDGIPEYPAVEISLAWPPLRLVSRELHDLKLLQRCSDSLFCVRYGQLGVLD